eukprot:4442116-Ditylum_brightwellii.AAC.1
MVQQKAPLDLLSLLLRSWPDATKEQDEYGKIPLYYACANGALSMEKRNNPAPKKKKLMTPIHYGYVCTHGAPLEAIILLLDKWLEATENRQSSDLVSIQNHPSGEVNNLLHLVSGLFNNEVLHDTSPSDIANHFINIELWNGVLLVINKHPAITKDFNLHTNVMADFLSLVGKRCSLTAMWE